MDTVSLVLTGSILPGADAEKAARALARLARISPEKALALLSSGKPRFVKRAVNPALGRVYVQKLAALGIESVLRPEKKAAQPEPLAPPMTEERRAPQAKPPAGQEETCNPYAAPRADMRPREKVRKKGGNQTDNWSDQARFVPAGHGLKWFKDTLALLAAKKCSWLAMAVAVAAITSCTNTLLLTSNEDNTSFLFFILWVLINAVIALKGEKQLCGDDAEFLEQVQENSSARRLIQLFLLPFLAVLYIIPVAIVLIAIIYIIFKKTNTLYLDFPQNIITSLQQSPIALALAFLCMSLIFVVVIAENLAPSLIVLAKKGVGDAMKKSIDAIFKNRRAFLLNIIVITLPSSLALLILTVSVNGKDGLVPAPFSTFISALFCFFFDMMSFTAARDLFYEKD